MKKIFIGLICVFALSLFFSYKSYALSDITLTSNTTNPCSGDCYELGYRYIIVNSSLANDGSYSGRVAFRHKLNNSTFSIYFPRFDLSIYSIPITDYTITGIYFVNASSIVISDHIPDSLVPTPEPCPEPEEPDPCPDPEENSRFIQVVLDAFWKYHMVFAGAVAGLIAIFVVYRIIKGMLR